MEECCVDGVEATQKGQVGWFRAAETTALTAAVLVKAAVVAERKNGRGETAAQLQPVKVVLAGTECSKLRQVRAVL